MKMLIALMLIACFFFCCKQKKVEATSQKEEMTTEGRIQAMFEKYIKTNNEGEFEKVCGDVVLAGNKETLLYYSMMMANKNNSPSAYFYVFMALANTDSSSIKDADSKTQNYALYNLIKSNELGYKNSEMEIRAYFGEGKSHPNSKYFLMRYSE